MDVHLDERGVVLHLEAVSVFAKVLADKGVHQRRWQGSEWPENCLSEDQKTSEEEWAA